MVCPCIQVLCIERNNFAQQRNGKLGLFFLKVPRGLPLERVDFFGCETSTGVVIKTVPAFVRRKICHGVIISRQVEQVS